MAGVRSPMSLAERTVGLPSACARCGPDHHRLWRPRTRRSRMRSSKLVAIRDQGILSEEEFSAAKVKLLGV